MTCTAALFALHPTRVESVAWVSERKDVLGVLYTSSTFPDHAPDHVLVRVMLGGARDPDRVREPDDALLAHARKVVSEVMGIGANPAIRHVMSHRQGIPQYNRGHAARMQKLQEARPGLYFLGWNYTGIGIRHTVRAAMEWTA